MAARKRKAAWSKIVEAQGVTVRLYERPGRGIYRDVHLEDGTRDRKSLGTSDRAHAEQLARALCQRLAELRLSGVLGVLTLGQAWTLYQQHRLPLLSPSRQVHVRQHAAFLLAHFGDRFLLEDLSQSHVDTFAAARRAGALRSKKTPASQPATVRDDTIRQNLAWLAALCRWARGHRINGRRLMTLNPFDGLVLPRERNVRRPVASPERYARTLAQAETVDPTGRFACLLVLARETGRRINALCQLRANDVHLTSDAVRRALAAQGEDEARAPHMPHGAVRFRAEHDKLGFDDLAPISRAARGALEAYLRRHPAIGSAPLFPFALSDPTRPMNKMQAANMLARAERLAGLPKLERGLWHAYRRAWASERKHLPDADVSAAGGWRDLATMKRSYQRPDPVTVLRAIENTPERPERHQEGTMPSRDADAATS